jgi:hypothetical protein
MTCRGRGCGVWQPALNAGSGQAGRPGAVWPASAQANIRSGRDTVTPEGNRERRSAPPSCLELFVGVGLRLAAGLPSGGEGLRRLRDASRAGLLAGGSVNVRLVS